MTGQKDFFADSAAYDRGMGRFSRVAGESFLDWLDLPPGLKCLDAGCGTGAFTEILLDRIAPAALGAFDPHEGQAAFAKSKPWAGGVDIRVGDAAAIPFDDAAFDIAFLALVIQFIPDPLKALAELARVVRPGGEVAAYVWPGRGDGHPMAPFQEAVQLADVAYDRRPGTTIRSIAGMVDVFREAGFSAIETADLALTFEFRDFEDCWSAMKGQTVLALTAAEIERLKAALRQTLPKPHDSRIVLAGRAYAIRGRVPGG